MDYAEQVTAATDDLATRLAIAARHEAGHIVIAAAKGLRLRPEGIMVDGNAEGLACLCKKPDGSDDSTERIILSTLAGYLAQKQFCEQYDYACPPPDNFAVIWSQDSKEARTLEGKLSRKYLSDNHLADWGLGLGAFLQQHAARLVLEYWPAIDAVACALLDKDLEELKPLKSGVLWSTHKLARCLNCEEVTEILAGFGIEAVRVNDCS